MFVLMLIKDLYRRALVHTSREFTEEE